MRTDSSSFPNENKKKKEKTYNIMYVWPSWRVAAAVVVVVVQLNEKGEKTQLSITRAGVR